MNKKKFIENLLSLFTLQGLNYLLPLITLPYLVRVLGSNNFGVITFATAMMQYFVVVTDYGFNMTATQRVSLNRENSTEINKIFNTVMFFKFMLLILSFFIMVTIVSLVPSLRENTSVYYVSFLLVLGNAIFPVWLFQGLEQMKYITIVNVISKALSTICIFLFVRSSGDFVLAAFFQSIGYVIAGIISLFFIKKLVDIKISTKDVLPNLKQYAVEGGHVFISSFAGNIYAQGAVLITGLVLGKVEAGYYSIAQRISAAVVGVAQPFTQAIFPYLARLFEESQIKFQNAKKKILIIGASISSCLGIGLYFFSGLVVWVVTGERNPELTSLLEVYSFVIITIILNVLLNPFILSMKKYSQMQKMYVTISVAFLFFSIPATYFLGIIGMAISILLVELFITIQSLRITREKSIQYSTQN
ncbi:flippase [Robertmurraya sp. GLU-23]